MSFALVSFDTLLLAWMSLAKAAPAPVEGQVAFASASALLAPRWWEGLVLVTSRIPPSSDRRPEPWQDGQVASLPNEF